MIHMRKKAHARSFVECESSRFIEVVSVEYALMEPEHAKAFWLAFFPSAFAEGPRFIPALSRFMHPEGLSAKAVREWLIYITSLFDMTATEWARLAKLAPSTLNRFIKSEGSANLSATTISALANALMEKIDSGEFSQKQFAKAVLPTARHTWTVQVCGAVDDTEPESRFEWDEEDDYNIKVPLPGWFISNNLCVEIRTDIYTQYPYGSILICQPAVLLLQEMNPGQKFLLHQKVDGKVFTSLRRLSIDPGRELWLTRLPGDLQSKAFYFEDVLPLGYSKDAFVSLGVIGSVTSEDWVGSFAQKISDPNL